MSLCRGSSSRICSTTGSTLEEIAGKTAVSEAVTNAIIHGYDNQ